MSERVEQAVKWVEKLVDDFKVEEMKDSIREAFLKEFGFEPDSVTPVSATAECILNDELSRKVKETYIASGLPFGDVYRVEFIVTLVESEEIDWAPRVNPSLIFYQKYDGKYLYSVFFSYFFDEEEDLDE